MNCVQIEQKGKYTYIKCAKCGTILASNDQELSLRQIKGNQLVSISSCQHFEVIENNGEIEIIPK